MNELKAYIKQLLPLSENEQEVFVTLFREKQLRKNDFFAKEGEFSTELGFITKGVLRAFYRNKEGDEYNKTFFTENNFVGAYSSLVTRQQNLIHIQCLTDCSFLSAKFGEITKLYDHYPKIERLSRILAEHFFVIKEKREIEMVMLDAREKYRLFQEKYPSLENLIPQYHIASYLGVTPTQLSRIRAKK